MRRRWASGPWSPCLRLKFGLPGAALACSCFGLALVVAGYGMPGPRRTAAGLASSPGAARLAASLAMVPVCLALKQYHVLLAVLGGAVTYVGVWLALGGLRHTAAVGAVLAAPPVMRPTGTFLIEPPAMTGIAGHATWRSPMKFCMITTFFGAHSFGGDAAYVDRL